MKMHLNDILNPNYFLLSILITIKIQNTMIDCTYESGMNSDQIVNCVSVVFPQVFKWAKMLVDRC